MVDAIIMKKGHEHYQPGQRVQLSRRKYAELEKKGIAKGVVKLKSRTGLVQVIEEEE